MSDRILVDQECLIVTVAAVHRETPDILTFELCAADDAPLPAYEPGAHIDVHLGPDLIRQYSLCGDPSDASRYLIAVKREVQSRGGSRTMHDSIEAGARLTIGRPRNRFRIAADAHRHVLFAGGIGITPLLGMAWKLAADGAEFELHYFIRSSEHLALGSPLQQPGIADAVRLHVATPPDRVAHDVHACLADARPGTHAYACGPGPFMDAVIAVAVPLLGSPTVHLERFQADTRHPTVEARSFEIELARSGRHFTVPPDRSIASILSAHGVACSTSCGEGVCGTCLTGVLDGVPDHRDSFLTPEERVRGDEMCLCVSRALTDRLVLDL